VGLSARHDDDLGSHLDRPVTERGAGACGRPLTIEASGEAGPRDRSASMSGDVNLRIRGPCAATHAPVSPDVVTGGSCSRRFEDIPRWKRRCLFIVRFHGDDLADYATATCSCLKTRSPTSPPRSRPLRASPVHGAEWLNACKTRPPLFPADFEYYRLADRGETTRELA